MSIPPLDIQQRNFRAAWRGLDRAEVDAFLNLVANEFETLTREVNELREERRHQARMLDEYRAREKAIQDTMVTAQRVTEEITENAKKEADIITGRAELEAEKLVDAAQERLTDVLSDIAEAKRQRAQFIAQLKGVVDTHQRLIAIADENESQTRGVEDNLAVMRRNSAPRAVSEALSDSLSSALDQDLPHKLPANR